VLLSACSAPTSGCNHRSVLYDDRVPGPLDDVQRPPLHRARRKDSSAKSRASVGDANADVIALQELDAPRTARTRGASRARPRVAPRNEAPVCRRFGAVSATTGRAAESPQLELQKVTTFASPHADAEPRGASGRATLRSGDAGRHHTHLGVHRNERGQQSQELVGEVGSGSASLRTPHLLSAISTRCPTRRRTAGFAAKLRMLSERSRAIARGHVPQSAAAPGLDHVFVFDDLDVRASTSRGTDVPGAPPITSLIIDLEMR